ncbi:hypothetical protein OPAG_06570 [Rhodococcus opacus PD630]|nr:hypothetical protein OPAG_06570 [Rhodococcus opacus PD630]
MISPVLSAARRRLRRHNSVGAVGVDVYRHHMNSPTPPKPYGSAADLPSFIELEQQLTEFKALGSLVRTNRDVDDQIAATEKQRRRLISIVDTFYELLGPRNWVFTDDLSIDAVETIIDTPDAGIAERRLIDYYKSDRRISFHLILLNKLPDMRPRLPMLEKALADYHAGRYYSTVLVLLAVMDGFVNDTDKQNGRKNLNSRDAADMVPWDSVAGHHLGLGHAHNTFNTGTYQTVTSETTELLRNGILHGMIVNFDNDVVATKAWNRLFAVVDWAKARQKQANPPKPKPTPTWSDIGRQFREQSDRRKRLDAWQQHEHTISSNVDEHTDVDRACLDFLRRWQDRQWGLVGKHFYVSGKSVPSSKKQAVLAKDLYGHLALTSWSLERIHHKGASLVEAHATLTVNDKPQTALMRWLYSDCKGGTLFDWQAGGVWQLSPYGPTVFLTEST